MRSPMHAALNSLEEGQDINITNKYIGRLYCLVLNQKAKENLMCIVFNSWEQTEDLNSHVFVQVHIVQVICSCSPVSRERVYNSWYARREVILFGACVYCSFLNCQLGALLPGVGSEVGHIKCWRRGHIHQRTYFARRTIETTLSLLMTVVSIVLWVDKRLRARVAPGPPETCCWHCCYKSKNARRWYLKKKIIFLFAFWNLRSVHLKDSAHITKSVHLEPWYPEFLGRRKDYETSSSLRHRVMDCMTCLDLQLLWAAMWLTKQSAQAVRR